MHIHSYVQVSDQLHELQQKNILCFCSGSGEDDMGVGNAAIEGER